MALSLCLLSVCLLPKHGIDVELCIGNYRLSFGFLYGCLN